jgi:hypothetical protein
MIVGKGYVTILSTNQRGPVERKPAAAGLSDPACPTRRCQPHERMSMGRSRFDGQSAMLAAARRWSSMRERRRRGTIMVAIGRGFVAVLSTDQRGPVLTRKAAAKSEAFMQAHALLDQAEDMARYRGEVVGVRVEQDAGG